MKGLQKVFHDPGAGVLLFIDLFFRPTREFFTHLETSPLQMNGCSFDLYLALMAIKQ